MDNERDLFQNRHIGPSAEDQGAMLQALGYDSLDEGTAAAEAMHLTEAVSKHEGKLTYLIDANCHPQTIAVVRTRAAARGIDVVVTDPGAFDFQQGNVIGALLQYPATDGAIRDYRTLCEQAHTTGALVTVATDLLALTLLAPPGEWGA